MPTYQRANETIVQLAAGILCEFETHKPLLDYRVKIDYIVARADVDKYGQRRNNALTWNGVRAYGLCRILGLKDRVMGRGDVEILIDGDWWDDTTEDRCRALVDHELHHIEVKLKKGSADRDDHGRPKLLIRKHDFQVGWFHVIAERHGAASVECLQAKNLMDLAGQYYWPELYKGRQ